MRNIRSWTIAPLLLLAAITLGQSSSWTKAYESGLKAAREGKWPTAREAFKGAVAMREEDVSKPTRLPGPPTEQRLWRGGAPYSPNFLAAYAAYRSALDMKDQGEQSALLSTAANEIESLLAKGQESREAYFYLDLIYTRLGDTSKRQTIADRYQKANGKFEFKIDDEIVAPEELAAMNGSSTNTGTTPVVIKAGEGTTGIAGVPTNPTSIGALPGAVAPVSSKFALIVGQSSSRLPGGAVPFANEDAQRVRTALMNFAGYPEANIEIAVNATAQQIAATAKALAQRVPENGTVLIYYSGGGVNLAGRDYLAGVDTESPTDTTTMLAKSELYGAFVSRGARIFAFFEVNRPIVGGYFFGSEVPLAGQIAQTQATLPDDSVLSTVAGGQSVGLYANAFVTVLSDLRTNRVPIQEFGWQVFYRLRRGNTGTTGGGSRQTPTLPVLNNMAADARF